MNEKLILVVDDEPRNLKLAMALLHVPGFRPIEASDGQQAVSLAQSLKPDLILMDLKMPVMNGYEVMEILREDEDCRNIPVIAVSAQLMEREKEKALQAGFKDFISKPYDIHIFLTTVKNCLSRDP